MSYDSNEQSIYAVVKLEVAGTGWQYILAPQLDTQYGFGAYAGKFATFYGNGTTWEGDFYANSPETSIVGSTHLLAGIQDGKDKPFINGYSQPSIDDAMDIINPNQITTIGAMQYPGVPYQFWDGQISEILLFNKDLSDQEHIKVQYYLSKKWGLESTVDSDGDGTLDELDVFPMDATEFEDTDSDGTGNNADTDDDNDGYSDAVETAAGTSTIDASDIPTVDLSDSVDAQIGEASGLDTIESNLSLMARCK